MWLIDNFLKKAMLGKEQFEIFLLYIVDMQGISRQRCLEKVQAIISKKQERNETTIGKRFKLVRAKKVLRVLK